MVLNAWALPGPIVLGVLVLLVALAAHYIRQNELANDDTDYNYVSRMCLSPVFLFLTLSVCARVSFSVRHSERPCNVPC